MGRSVGSFRPKIFAAALRAAVGRSGCSESKTRKPLNLGRSVEDAYRTFNFAFPLVDGDSGVDGRNVKRKVVGSAGGKKKKKKGVRVYMGHEWTAEEEDGFEVEAIVRS